MTEKLTCFKHPDRETLVSCGRCGRGLCPDCVRHGATGVRCEGCIRLSPREQGLATSKQLWRAVAAAGAVALSGGVVLGLLGFLNIIGAFLLGLAVGAAAFLASGRHRDPAVQGVAGATALLGVLVGAVLVSYGMPGTGGQFGRVLLNVSFFEFIGPALAAILGAVARFLM